MARYTPQNFGGDLAPLNPEFEKIKQAIDDTLSRVGDTPNSITATLDFNSNRLINLPAPQSDAEPFRKVDLPNVEAQVVSVKDAAVITINTEESNALSAISTAETNAVNNISADLAAAAASAALSEQWATSLTLVDGENYGSKKYSQDASNSATAASNSASAASTSASNASTSESNALQYSQDALGYRDTTLTYRNEAEVFRNEAQAAAQQATNVLTASATAVTGSINEFQSSIAVKLPLANSVPANTVCSFLVQEKYKAGAKTINVQGTDTASDEVGTDTSVVLSDGLSGRVYLISDGVSDWRV